MRRGELEHQLREGGYLDDESTGARELLAWIDVSVFKFALSRPGSAKVLDS